jgi:hypothetical protein
LRNKSFNIKPTMNDTQKRPLEPEPNEMDGNNDDAKRHDGKGTPNKPKTDPNGRLQPKLADETLDETPRHGSTKWCASRTLCAIIKQAADKELCCIYCKLYVHQECTTESSDGKVTCTRCAEINTCDTILRSEESTGKEVDIGTSDDVTVTSTATEVAANVSPLENSESNLSSKSALEDKQELVNFITTMKGITEQSDDKYIHIVANIAGVPLGIEDIPMPYIEQMVKDIKTALLHESFNRTSLHSNRYKLLANFTGLKLPKSPHNKTVKDKIIQYCYDRVPALSGKSAMSKPAFQEMSKITGTYAITNSISEINKKKILHLALQKIQSAKISDIKIDQKAHEILTKCKTDYENNITIFGEKQWCALGFKCRNPALKAPDHIKCNICNYPVHRFCGEGDPTTTFECLSCQAAKKPPAIIHTKTTTITSPFGGPSVANSAESLKSTTPSTSITQPSVVSTATSASTNTTNRSDTDIDGNPNTPIKNNPSTDPISNRMSTTSDIHTTMNPIDATTIAAADLTITSRQTNILNFNDFDNESTEAEVMHKTRCDIRLNIRATGRFATSQDVIREARAFVQELRNCDPTVMILPWYSNTTNTAHALSLNDFPTNLKDLNRYFPRLRSQS